MPKVSTLFITLLALALAGPLVAQQVDSLPRDTIVQRLPPLVVTASLLPLVSPPAGAGSSGQFVIVGPGEIRARVQRTLVDALEPIAGFSTYDDLGSEYKRTLVARGFTASPVVGLPQGLSVFIDGIPVNEPDAGQVNFELLPLAHVERVELFAGTASLLGPNSLGGAVNLITRQGEQQSLAELSLFAGSESARGARGALSGSSGPWHYFLGGAAEREEGWRQLTGAHVSNLFMNFGRAGNRGGVNLQLFAARSNVETAGSLPRSVYVTRPDSNLSAGDFEDLGQLHAAIAAHRRLGAGTLIGAVYARVHDAERYNVNQELDPDVRAFSRNRTAGVRGEWRSLQHSGLSVRAGGVLSGSRTSVRIFAERIDPGLTTEVESPILKGAAFALADIALGRAVLSFGARQDVVRIPFRNRLDSTRDTTNLFVQFNPRAGVQLAIGRGVSLNASAARSFRAPAVIELACADPEEPCPLPFALGDDPPLDPVVATTMEGGAAWSAGYFTTSVTVYRTDVRDDIFLFPYVDDEEPAGSTIDGYFANIPRTRRMGAEAGVTMRLPAGHALHATWGATRATFESGGFELFSIREEAGGDNDVEPGDRLPLVPRFTAAVGGTACLTRSVCAGLDGRYVGERFLRGDEANEEEPLAAYWVAVARLGVEHGPWRAQIVVRNVLDRRYETFGTFNINQGAGGAVERFLTPGEPRSFRLTLEHRWQR